MKHKAFNSFINTLILMVSFRAGAHSRHEHPHQQNKPDCSVLEHNDDSHVDRSDPVFQVLIQKCIKLHEGKNENKKKQDHEKSKVH